MRNLLNFVSLFFISLFIISYQNPYVKLSGKPISSDSEKESPLNNAFDGDSSTTFKSQKASEGWIGLKLDSKYKITVMDLLCKDKLKNKLLAIQNEYVPERLKNEYNLEIKDFTPEYQELLTDEQNIDMFLFYVDEFISKLKEEISSPNFFSLTNLLCLK